MGYCPYKELIVRALSFCRGIGGVVLIRRGIGRKGSEKKSRILFFQLCQEFFAV